MNEESAIDCKHDKCTRLDELRWHNAIAQTIQCHVMANCATQIYGQNNTMANKKQKKRRSIAGQKIQRH